MINKIKFSIVVPVYNKSEYIKNTLSSVLSQSYANFEVIVVDDGSKDNSVEIIKSIEDQRIKLICKENGGVSSARNRGIYEAVGEYIAFLDADDLWEDDYLEEVNELLTILPDAEMICSRYKVQYKNDDIYPTFMNMNDRFNKVDNYIELADNKWNIATSSNTIIKTSILKEMKMIFPEFDKVGEDLSLWFRVALKHNVYHSSKVTAIYNRDTTYNARTYNSVHYPSHYLKILKKEILSGEHNQKDIIHLNNIFDKKMVAYIYSLICSRKKVEAKNELKNWCPKYKYKNFKYGLIIALYMPGFVIDLVTKIRLKIY